ncbi:hypothetical protein COOONC_08188 [Cooperia oncophora]
MIIRNANYVCRCHEMKPYDICSLTTTLESEDVPSVRSSESGLTSDDDNATEEIMLNINNITSTREDTDKEFRAVKK